MLGRMMMMLQEIDDSRYPSATVTPLFERYAPIVKLARHGRRVLAVGTSIEVIRGLCEAGCQTIAVSTDEHVLADAAVYCERVIVAPFNGLDSVIELADEEFDIVIVDEIENLFEPESVLLATKRYVRSAGRLIASVQNATDLQLRLALLSGELPHANGQREHCTPARYYTRDAAVQLLVHAGFDVSNVERLKRQADERAPSTATADISARLLDALQDDPEAQTERFLLVGQVSARADTEFVEHRVRRLTSEVAATRHSITSLSQQQSAHLQCLDTLANQVNAFIDGQAVVPETVGALESRQQWLEDRVTGLVSDIDSGLRFARSPQPAALQNISKHVDYQRLIHRIRGIVRVALPARASVAVVSRGDDDLLSLDDRETCHFPRNDDGVYAGHYPATGVEAIDLLEALRDRGVEYILFPATSLWWLDYYAELRQHLDNWYRIVVNRSDTCVIFTPVMP